MPADRPADRRAHGLSALLVLLALAAFSLLAACGGGGGGGSTPTSPPPPPPPPTLPSVTFTPAAAAGAGSLYLGMGAASTPTNLVLEVRSGGVANWNETASANTPPVADAVPAGTVTV